MMSTDTVQALMENETRWAPVGCFRLFPHFPKHNTNYISIMYQSILTTSCEFLKSAISFALLQICICLYMNMKNGFPFSPHSRQAFTGACLMIKLHECFFRDKCTSGLWGSAVAEKLHSSFQHIAFIHLLHSTHSFTCGRVYKKEISWFFLNMTFSNLRSSKHCTDKGCKLKLAKLCRNKAHF